MHGDIVKEGAANYWTGRVVRGGRLFLTASTLQFVPHKVDKFFGGQSLTVKITDVAGVAVTHPQRLFTGFASMLSCR